MRYRETGEVHRDFHRTLNGTIAWLREKYGREFLDSTFRRTARDVYRSIREDLLSGDPDQLIEHWTYYFGREGGKYAIERTSDTIRMTVTRCPAVAYLRERNSEIDPDFCRQTIVINESLAEGSPFRITTEITGDGKCVQTVRKVDNDTE